MTIVAPRQTSVYLYFDRHDLLLYVGITSRATKRQREHNSDKEWWQFVAKQTVEHYPTRPEAEARERDLISRHCPPWNKQHNPAHNEVRNAYLVFRAAESQPTNHRDILRAMENRLDLDVHKHDASGVVLRTRLDGTALATAVDLTIKPKVHGLRKGGSAITDMRRAGPLLLLTMQAKPAHGIRDAYLSIKFSANQQLKIAHVHVYEDHLDGNPCTAKCPMKQRQRPQVRVWRAGEADA